MRHSKYFVTYTHQFREDDPAPAQWTEEGKRESRTSEQLTDPSKLDNAGADWTKSKPVRVIRSDKMRHSKYAPTEGFRCDSIYKLLRYWPEKGKDGFVTYKYQFRTDDPAPAPWTEEAEARVEELSLRMVCSEGKQEDNEEEEEEKIPLTKNGNR
ncbi:hypothetical protein L211DRAFT_853874 [Terfezia boudieri ATCC MYA-4762]|uniref:YDG domain-containing protein n=1 Tax=Terfezia boudieri ATCC MYA-4762 TaxID=1051890 RepID=A0A3N4LL95_9PEZI|nr:hypothetical protein L211DRAFT_853870 [Terfezia boudieri ATCC MYA-4762]RPB18700.1 hypothetical protein L211DRAFT_853874 [Terfezia boudieri ATCC MYA-4762]